MPEQACVHIIDDDDGVRRVLAYALGNAGFASRIYASADLFMRGAANAAPGCVITDLRLPGLTGMDLVKRLKSEGVPHPVIVITGHADVELAVEAMKAGAADFLEKPVRPAAVVDAVKGVLARQERSNAYAQEAAAYRRMLATLTPRQKDVLEGVLAGKLNKTIAHDLGISVRTVEGYRADIMTRTQAKNSSDLIRMALLATL
jgi:two-component system response regulator FixJ